MQKDEVAILSSTFYSNPYITLGKVCYMYK